MLGNRFSFMEEHPNEHFVSGITPALYKVYQTKYLAAGTSLQLTAAVLRRKLVCVLLIHMRTRMRTHISVYMAKN